MSEQDAVKQVIVDAYIEGLQRQHNQAVAQKGFHPDFKMLTLRDDALIGVTLDQWFDRINTAKAEDPDSMNFKIDYTIHSIDIRADVAVVKMDVLRDGNFFATDYMMLYKFSDGWKIVSKVFTFTE